MFAYDRRGRGQSGDTQPYSPAREVEDIAALIQEAGGSASLVGLSSGGALALEAAAAGLSISTRWWPTSRRTWTTPVKRGGAAYEGQLKRLLASGNRGGAVKYFMKDMVGAPAPFVVVMRLMPWIWRKLEAVAHTLPVRRGGDDRVQDSASALRIDRDAGARHERVEDRSQVEGSRAGDRADDSRRAARRAGRARRTT